jgi:hypothetical protein
MNRTKRLAAIAGAGAVLVAGLAVPVTAWAADPSPIPSTTSSSSPEPGGERGPGRGPRGHGDRGQMAAKLAELLGVDQVKVATALEEIRKEGGGQRPAKDAGEADRQEAADEFAAKLAEKLGIAKDKVTAALEKLKQQRTADAEAALSERLKAAVTAGKLTQAESDAVLKAFRAGVLGGGPKGVR